MQVKQPILYPDVNVFVCFSDPKTTNKKHILYKHLLVIKQNDIFEFLLAVAVKSAFSSNEK